MTPSITTPISASTPASGLVYHNPDSTVRIDWVSVVGGIIRNASPLVLGLL